MHNQNLSNTIGNDEKCNQNQISSKKTIEISKRGPDKKLVAASGSTKSKPLQMALKILKNTAGLRNS